LFASAFRNKNVVAVPTFGLIRMRSVQQVRNFKLRDRDIILLGGLDLLCNGLRCASTGNLLASAFGNESAALSFGLIQIKSVN